MPLGLNNKKPFEPRVKRKVRGGCECSEVLCSVGSYFRTNDVHEKKTPHSDSTLQFSVTQRFDTFQLFSSQEPENSFNNPIFLPQKKD